MINDTEKKPPIPCPGGWASRRTCVTPVTDISGLLTRLIFEYQSQELNCSYNLKDGILSIDISGEQREKTTKSKELTYTYLAALDQTVKTCGLCLMNGYDVRTNGLPDSAGRVSLSAEFSSGELVEFRGNGGKKPNGFDNAFSELSACIYRIFG